MYIYNNYNFEPFLDIKNGEDIKPINDFPDYYITNFGNVYSTKRNYIKKIAKTIDSRNLYITVHLCSDKPHNVLLHRLVAKAFIPNPYNLPEVNHKDKNTKNYRFDNLEWCTRKENLYDSYSTMSSIRNYNSCKLYKNGKFIKEFKSIKDAKRYAEKEFKVSGTSLEKYLRVADIVLITSKTNRKVIADGNIHKTQNRSPITLKNNNKIIGTFKAYKKVQQYIIKEKGYCCTADNLNAYKKYKEYTLERDL